MSKIALSPSASGTGTFTIASPNSNSDRTLNLPDAAGTIQVSGNPISGTTGTFTGLVDISAAGAGQIQFPATQNASANANTLDDYEEGTWTTSVSSPTNVTGTPVLSEARYTKIGNLVYLEGSFNATVTSSNLNTFWVFTIPFVQVSATSKPCGALKQENNFIVGAVSDATTGNNNNMYASYSASAQLPSGNSSHSFSLTYITST